MTRRIRLLLNALFLGFVAVPLFYACLYVSPVFAGTFYDFDARTRRDGSGAVVVAADLFFATETGGDYSIFYGPYRDDRIDDGRSVSGDSILACARPDSGWDIVGFWFAPHSLPGNLSFVASLDAWCFVPDPPSLGDLRVIFYFEPTPTPTPVLPTPTPALTATPFVSAGYSVAPVSTVVFSSAGVTPAGTVSPSIFDSVIYNTSMYTVNNPENPGILGTAVSSEAVEGDGNWMAGIEAMIPNPPAPTPRATPFISVTPVVSDDFEPWTGDDFGGGIGTCSGVGIDGDCIAACYFDAAGYLHMELESWLPPTTSFGGQVGGDFDWDADNCLDGPFWSSDGYSCTVSGVWEDKDSGKIRGANFPYTLPESLSYPVTVTLCGRRTGPVWDSDASSQGELWLPDSSACEAVGSAWEAGDFSCQYASCDSAFSAIEPEYGLQELRCKAASGAGEVECSWSIRAYVDQGERVRADCAVSVSVGLADNDAIWANREDASYDAMPGGLDFFGYEESLFGASTELFFYNLADSGSHYYSGSVDSVLFAFGFEDSEYESQVVDLRVDSGGFLTRTLPYTGGKLLDPRIIDGDCHVLVPELDSLLGKGSFFPGAQYCIKYVDPGLDLPFIPESILYNAIAGIVALTLFRLIRGK